MANILITGASGTMGSRLVAGLASKGHRLRALALPGDPGASALATQGCEVVVGDITRPQTLEPAMSGMDTVYHLAAVILCRDPGVFARVNWEGTRAVVRAAVQAGAQHFIYASSASVTYPRRTPYAESKWLAERWVASEKRIAHTVVRPTLAYDETGGVEFMLFWRYLERFPAVPFIGAGRARKRPVWVEDLVSGFVSLADNPISHGKCYNFSGGESVTIRELAELMLLHGGMRKRFVSIPIPICRALATAMELTLRDPPLTHSAIAGIVQDADLDCKTATRDLGYTPLGVREGLARCFPI